MAPVVIDAMTVAHHTVPRCGVFAGCGHLLSVEELAEVLGVPRRFVYRLVQERRLPYFKCGRYLRFDATDVAAWLSNARVESLSDP